MYTLSISHRIHVVFYNELKRQIERSEVGGLQVSERPVVKSIVFQACIQTHPFPSYTIHAHFHPVVDTKYFQ